MPSGNPKIAEAGKATQFPKGTSGNPSGPKPGYKHLSTHIQALLNDDKFEGKYIEGYEIKEIKGRPMEAIIKVVALKALAGDPKMVDILWKYGYGTKTEVEHSGGVALEGAADPELKERFNDFMKKETQS